MLVGETQEAVEGNLVFAYVRMNVQADLRTQRRQFGKRGHADGDVISYAAGIDDGLVRVLDEQLATQVSDHAGDIVASIVAEMIGVRMAWKDKITSSEVQRQ